MEEHTNFASELLAEVKAQSKRNFILFIIMVILEAFTIAWFTLPDLSTSNVTVDSEDNGVAGYYEGNDIGGDLNNGKGDSEESNHN